MLEKTLAGEMEGLRMREVSYFAPTKVGKAAKLLAEYGDKAIVLAGGTDLMPKINHYDLWPEVIVYIGGLGLDYIKEEGGKLIVGATTSTAKIAASELVAAKAPALAEAARGSGSVGIRTSATIGGNVANASPGADLAAPLLAMDAKVVLASAEGERVVPIGEFFTGPHETVLKAGELITEFHVPIPKGNTVWAGATHRHFRWQMWPSIWRWRARCARMRASFWVPWRRHPCAAPKRRR
jgi:CO/xanthine dehydrogenase FAD-binding subunit